MRHISNIIENYLGRIQYCMMKCIDIDSSDKTKSLAFKCLDEIYLNNNFDIHNRMDVDMDDDNDDDMDINMLNNNNDDKKIDDQCEPLSQVITKFYANLGLGISVCKPTGMLIR